MPISRAKALRIEQNHRAYEKRRSLVKPSIRMPTIPPGALDLASLRLPKKTATFFSHFKPTYTLSTNDDMAHWDGLPPYSPSDYLTLMGLTRVGEGLHGRRLRIHREFELERMVRFKTATPIAFAQEVRSDLVRCIQEWKALKRMLKKISVEETDHFMGMHLLQWKSRYIYHLIEDMKALKVGQESFIELFNRRW